jgi:glycosyltransferase involved in cell wall biosynthesis
MGTYPPRECGIATFNQDLLDSSQQFLGADVSCKVAAMNLFPLDTYIYPPEVEWEIDQDSKKEHRALARKFNEEPLITGVIIQHEYGIYGGIEGENLLSFIEPLKKPIVVTLHTVLPNPSEKMKEVTEKIIRRANIIVVLTQNSKKILEEVYPQSVDKVYVIPHGIHPTPFAGTKSAKRKLKLANKTVLSTFGLLSRGKGIEYVIEALPKLVRIYPSIQYLILGETHPVVRRNEGESYRKELAHLVTKLKLEEHVKFYDQYLSLSDLIKFLKATDVYISTSINPNQAVSGTLSYALGTGRAVISTAFAQAKEIVTEGTGRLVPIKKSESYRLALLELLHDKLNLKKMHKKAYEQTRPMLWSNVAHEYSKLLTQHILPPIDLTHLQKMTDKFGLFQFANLDKPNKIFGYTLDDNARALIVCCQMDNLANKKVESLINIYLKFIESCQQDDGTFINYVDHLDKAATDQNKQEDLEEATARAMLALSEVIKNKAMGNKSRNLAKKMFIRCLPTVGELSHLRSAAFVICAFSNVIAGDSKLRSTLVAGIRKYAEMLNKQYEKNSDKSWLWFETHLSYNNAIMPQALFIAGQITKLSLYTDTAKSTLKFLVEKTFTNNRYMPIGQSKWYKNTGERSHYDQQPEDPASMILALVTAYEITHDVAYRSLAAICFSWYLGNNSLQLPLYNAKNGGCYDGLQPTGANLNQGAESQVSYLLSRLAVEKMNIYENPRNKTHISRPSGGPLQFSSVAKSAERFGVFYRP